MIHSGEWFIKIASKDRGEIVSKNLRLLFKNTYAVGMLVYALGSIHLQLELNNEARSILVNDFLQIRWSKISTYSLVEIESHQILLIYRSSFKLHETKIFLPNKIFVVCSSLSF